MPAEARQRRADARPAADRRPHEVRQGRRGDRDAGARAARPAGGIRLRHGDLVGPCNGVDVPGPGARRRPAVAEAPDRPARERRRPRHGLDRDVDRSSHEGARRGAQLREHRPAPGELRRLDSPAAYPDRERVAAGSHVADATGRRAARRVPSAQTAAALPVRPRATCGSEPGPRSTGADHVPDEAARNDVCTAPALIRTTAASPAGSTATAGSAPGPRSTGADQVLVAAGRVDDRTAPSSAQTATASPAAPSATRGSVPEPTSTGPAHVPEAPSRNDA